MPVTFAVRGPVALPSGAGVYVGPGDLVPGLTGFWGARAASLADIGKNAIQLKRNDAATLDITTIAGGGLDMTAGGGVVAWLSGHTATIEKYYNQIGSGNPNLVPAGGSGNGPAFTIVSGLPRITYVAATANEMDDDAASFSTTMPETFVVFAYNTDASGVQSGLMGFSTSGFNSMGFHNSATNQVFIYAGTVVPATASNNNWHSLAAVFNGASSYIGVDGSMTGPSDAGSGTGCTILSVAGVSGSQQFDGYIGDICYWGSTAISSPDLAHISDNQHTYWGV